MTLQAHSSWNMQRTSGFSKEQSNQLGSDARKDWFLCAYHIKLFPF